MAQQNFDYLRNEFSFKANRNNPKGLDFRGLDDIQRMPQKIDKRTLREHFGADGKMKAKSYQDFLYEIKLTRSKLNLTVAT